MLLYIEKQQQLFRFQVDESVQEIQVKDVRFNLEWDNDTCYIEKQKLEKNLWSDILVLSDSISCYLCRFIDNIFYLKLEKIKFLCMSQDETADIQIPLFEGMAYLVKKKDTWHLHVRQVDKVYVNKSYCFSTAELKQYDTFFICGVEFIFMGEMLRVQGVESEAFCHGASIQSVLLPYQYVEQENLKVHVESQTIKLPEQPKEENITYENILRQLLPLISSVVISVVMFASQQSSIGSVMSLVVTIVTGVLLIMSYYEKRKQTLINNKRSKDAYTLKCVECLEQFQKLRLEEQSAYQCLFPTIQILCHTLGINRSYLGTRIPQSKEFLKLRIGTYFKQSCILLEAKGEDELLSLNRKEIQVPLIFDLKKNVLILGKSIDKIKLLKQLLLQFCMTHSFHRVALIFIMRCEELEKIRLFLDPRILAPVYAMIDVQLAKEALLYWKQEKNISALEGRTPIFIFGEMTEQLQKFCHRLHTLDENIGYAVLAFHGDIVVNQMFQEIITIFPEKRGMKQYMEGEQNKRIHFIFDELLEEHVLQKNWMQLRLFQPLHISKEHSIPHFVHFYELFEEDMHASFITKEWEMNRSSQDLRVPLGIGRNRRKLFLDLHEQKDGPHMLIAGMTGSGKSELIQTIILGLAVRYTPDTMSFIFIDYKGGGTSQFFASLPHCVGIMTNLDEGAVTRALVMLQAEIRKRQKLLVKYQCQDFNQYEQRYGDTAAYELMPSLLIVVDEFAELKEKQPQMLTELVSIARIGRSLGIHLLLATQKPSGVVSDQIWSNSRCRIALKVESQYDSKEMIGHERAAFCTNPGHAFMKVGNDEVQEEFQTAYCSEIISGADIEKPAIRLVEDESPEAQNVDGKTVRESVIEAINTALTTTDCWRKPPTVLVPELPKRVFVDKSFSQEKYFIGIKDAPRDQRQEKLYGEIKDVASLLIIGNEKMRTPAFVETFVKTWLSLHQSYSNSMHVSALQTKLGATLHEETAILGITGAGVVEGLKSFIAFLESTAAMYQGRELLVVEQCDLLLQGKDGYEIEQLLQTLLLFAKDGRCDIIVTATKYTGIRQTFSVKFDWFFCLDDGQLEHGIYLSKDEIEQVKNHPLRAIVVHDGERNLVQLAVIQA